jgi:putative membrane protein
MKRIVAALILLMVLVAGLAFAVMNAGDVELNYYFAVRSVPLSLALVVSLSMGALLGLLFSAGIVLSLKRENAKLRKKLKSVGSGDVDPRKVSVQDIH